MIQLTVQEMVESIPVLKELSTKTLRGRTSYQIARLMREVQKESELFESARVELVQKYADRDENGKMRTDKNGNTYIAQDDIQKFNEEITELLNNPITINGDKIALSDIEDLDFTPAQMVSLTPFIEE